MTSEVTMNAPQELLDPNLVFNASTVRAFFDERNRKFAKVIVRLISRHGVQNRPFILRSEGEGWGYSDRKTIEWDRLLGFHAVDAFCADQISVILDLARRDLEKRGFQVDLLELDLNNDLNGGRRCNVPADECKCKCHGIFLRWDLKIGSQDSSNGMIPDADGRDPYGKYVSWKLSRLCSTCGDI